MRTAVTLFTLCTLAGVSQAQVVKYSPVNLEALAMEDQFERAFRVGAMKGHVLVLIYGDRNSAEANQQLGQWLHVAFHPTARGLPPRQAQAAPVRPLPGAGPDAAHPDVRAIPVACIGKVPGLVAGFIRRQIKSGSPDVPVLLDFDDTMKENFGLQPRVPNLVVLDRSGRLRYGAKGVLNEAQLQQLAELIENLRREPVDKQ